jgi:hypothetical protein
MILTRNLKHFTAFGIAAHDPFRALPGEEWPEMLPLSPYCQTIRRFWTSK